MTIIPTSIPEVLIIEPKIFGDERGFFFESYNERNWRELTGQNVNFVQHNHSRSATGVLRGDGEKKLEHARRAIRAMGKVAVIKPGNRKHTY